MAGSVEESADWLGLADQAIRAARMLLDTGFYRDAMSKAYYAMFYAAKAATLSEGVRSSKHSSVVSSFGLHFARTGRIPAHLHRALMDAFDDRQSADYRPRWQARREDADARLAQAEEFVFEVKRVLPPSPSPDS